MERNLRFRITIFEKAIQTSCDNTRKKNATEQTNKSIIKFELHKKTFSFVSWLFLIAKSGI